MTLAQGLTNFVTDRQHGRLAHVCGPEQKTYLYKIFQVSELIKY
jgi:hypothetical protein